MKRQSYDGVVIAAPTSVPYARYSNETAHWWIARALRAMLDQIGDIKQRHDRVAIRPGTGRDHSE